MDMGWRPSIKIEYDKEINGEDWFNFELNSEYTWYLNGEIKNDEEFQKILNEVVND